MATDDSWREHGLLGADNLLSLLQFSHQHLHLLLLLFLLSQQLITLLACCGQPLLCRTQVEGEKFLTVEEPLYCELGQPQDLDQSRVHWALTSLAPLPVQAAKGHCADVLLKGVHIQLAHHQIYVHCVDSPPIHTLSACPELKRENSGGSARWSHTWCGNRVAVYRVLAQR